VSVQFYEDDYDDQEADDDWYDDRDDREPDPEDYEINRAYEEHAQHCEDRHGGGECTCRPSPWWPAVRRLRAIIGWFPVTWWRVRYSLRTPWTVRIPGLEVTVRFRPRRCGACSGRGWFYTKGTLNPVPMPEGHDGVALCGCGSAIGQLAGTRRYLRKTRNDPPF